MTIIGIDPGPVESAYVVWDGVEILSHEKFPNDCLAARLEHPQTWFFNGPVCLVVEKLACYGMAVGAEVLETAWSSGRFHEAFAGQANRLTRLEVKMHLCHDSRAKDTNVRQALIDRFGGPAAIRAGQKSKPRKGLPETPAGALYGISGDEWTALALCITFWDSQREGKSDG
jgi:hypothetical protein